MNRHRKATSATGNRLTVVVTTYERPNYLRESLATIASQSVCDAIEVVVLDNASTSDYANAISEHMDDLNLKYVRNEINIGPDGNILRALADFRDTAYLTVFHDDDLMHPRMLEWQMQMLDEDPNLLFVASQYVSFADGDDPPFEIWSEIETPRVDVYAGAGDFVRGILSGSELCFSSVMYRMSVLDSVRVDFERFGMYGDRPYLVDIAACGKSALIKAPLVFYRIHGAQYSMYGTQSFTNLIELMKAYREQLDVVADSGDRKLFRDWSNRFMIGTYGMLPPASRPSLREFVRRTRFEGVLWPEGLSPLQWARIVRAAARGWIGRRRC